MRARSRPSRSGRSFLSRHLSRYLWTAMKDGSRKPAEATRWIKTWGWDGGRLYRAGVMVEGCFPDWEPASVIRGTEGRFTQRAQRLLRPASGSGGEVSTPRALRAQRSCLGLNIPAHLCWREANLRRRSPEGREGKGHPPYGPAVGRGYPVVYNLNVPVTCKARVRFPKGTIVQQYRR